MITAVLIIIGAGILLGLLHTFIPKVLPGFPAWILYLADALVAFCLIVYVLQLIGVFPLRDIPVPQVR